MRSGSAPAASRPGPTPSYQPKRSGSSGCSSSTTIATFASASPSSGGRSSSAARTCSSNVTLVRGLERLSLAEQRRRKRAEHEAADVREERHAATLLRLHEREATRPELEYEPDDEEEPGGELADDDEEEEDRCHNAGAGEKNEVGAEHRRDGPARAEVRDLRVRRSAGGERDDRLERRRREAAEKVEDDVAHPAERVLDVVPEDPEKEHVPGEVEPAAMHEHRADDVHGPVLAHDGARPVDLARLVRQLVHRVVEVGQLVEEPDGDVDCDQRRGHDRKGACRGVVLEREHAPLPDHEQARSVRGDDARIKAGHTHVSRGSGGACTASI